jgi:hypothetical protein
MLITRSHIHPYKHTYTYEHLRRTELADLEIHEVTTTASMSTGTSSTTESIASLDLGINPGKYEITRDIEDLNPGVQILSQGTQSTYQFAGGSSIHLTQTVHMACHGSRSFQKSIEKCGSD